MRRIKTPEFNSDRCRNPDAGGPSEPYISAHGPNDPLQAPPRRQRLAHLRAERRLDHLAAAARLPRRRLPAARPHPLRGGDDPWLPPRLLRPHRRRLEHRGLRETLAPRPILRLFDVAYGDLTRYGEPRVAATILTLHAAVSAAATIGPAPTSRRERGSILRFSPSSDRAPRRARSPS